MINSKLNLENLQNELANLPKKQNFKIGEVAQILNLKTHVLRYWEDEFTLLKPKKFINNQRLYYKKDIELLFIIKALLYDYNFSVKGVKKNLAKHWADFNQAKTDQNTTSKACKRYEKGLENLLEEIQQARRFLNNSSV